MKKSTIRIVAVALGIFILMFSGYLVGRWVQIPQVVTHTVEESATEASPPSDQLVSRQIRALTERNPIEAAREVWSHEDPWVYGMISGGSLLVPGIPNDSPIITDKILPVKVIAWTGLKGSGAGLTMLDGVAERYAEAYNLETDRILCTN